LTAKLPKSVDARSAFGSYTAEYRQNGTELIVSRKVALPGFQPPIVCGFHRVASTRGTDDTR